MATVQVNLCTTNARIQQQPVADDVIVAGEAITSSGVSQATTITAGTLMGQDEFWVVTASGGPIWVTFAAVPVAAAGVSWLVPDGVTLWLRATPGNKAAVVDAA